MKTDPKNLNGPSLVQGCSDEGPMFQGETWLAPRRNLDVRRIVVPVDFSAASRKALQYAAATALEFGAEIWLVHVVQQYPVIPELPVATAEMELQQRKSAAQDLEEWAKTAGPIRAACAVRVGDPGSEIINLAKKNHADLIIMATSGRTGLAHMMIGSVAEKVVRSAPCPVLIVREREEEFLRIDPDDAILNRVGIVCGASAT